MFNFLKFKKESDEKIEEGLTQTRQGFFKRIAGIFELNEVSDELWDELEELLIQADVGIETTTALLERLRDRADDEGDTN
ncbi:MAG: signal recognition particle receptor subunit alpha, partial [Chloroflexi bacterium]|nr:signal recognition particle receptor subunit alpha [Chloroflexota bacterium]